MWYGLVELAFVLFVVALVTVPFWGRRLFDWMTRPFGAPRYDEKPEEEDDDG